MDFESILARKAKELEVIMKKSDAKTVVTTPKTTKSLTKHN
jgi:hypothetical protein